MSWVDTLTEQIETILNTKWDKRSGNVIPESEDVALKDGAVEIEATFLYADLAGSSKLARFCPWRTTAKIIRAYLDCCVRLIKGYGGEIRSFDGDRVMGVFKGESQNTNASKCAREIDWVVEEVLNPRAKGVDPLGNIRLVKEQVGNTKPSFRFSGNNIMIWGVWQDNAKNIYAAVFSDQSVKKIDPARNMTDIYKSKSNWAPLHGVFDNDNKLWVLESSDNNDVRVTLVETTPITTHKTNSILLTSIIISCIILGIVILYLKFKSFNSVKLNRLKS